jgi:thiamine pyrophosphate-dependent acetolactate synthase large subunit-like protein
METQPVFEALARAFAAESDRHFALMGDGNMHFVTSLARKHGVNTIHARHEHAALSMAIGHARATGNVGVASVTMGPGLAQATAALTTAARGGIPLVLFAGETSTASGWALQELDQAAVAKAAGAAHIPVRSAGRALAAVREAFYLAAAERRPVVLSVPIDIQKQRIEPRLYEPSTMLVPRLAPLLPSPEAVAKVARAIDAAARPIVIAGRGLIGTDIAPLIALAARAGALLSTTLPARNMFRDETFDIGIAGGFSTGLARSLFAECDLVVGIGAGLGYHTADGGKLYPQARVVQIDTAPRGMRQGLPVADMHLASDAALAVQALLPLVAAKTGFRTKEVAARIRDDAGDTYAFPEEPGAVDPRALMAEIDAVVPKDWTVVASTGHSFYFSAALTPSHPPERFHSILDFGAIGSNLAYAMGMAAAQGDGKVIVFDGDGSFLMQMQELETIRRHGLRLLVIVLDDGAYGAELHKLEAEDFPAEETLFGRPPLAEVARAFGLRSATVCELGGLRKLFEAHVAAGEAEVWDVHVSRHVVSPYYRHEHWKGPQRAGPAKAARVETA